MGLPEVPSDSCTVGLVSLQNRSKPVCDDIFSCRFSFLRSARVCTSGLCQKKRVFVLSRSPFLHFAVVDFLLTLALLDVLGLVRLAQLLPAAAQDAAELGEGESYESTGRARERLGFSSWTALRNSLQKSMKLDE